MSAQSYSSWVKLILKEELYLCLYFNFLFYINNFLHYKNIL